MAATITDMLTDAETTWAGDLDETFDGYDSCSFCIGSGYAHSEVCDGLAAYYEAQDEAQG